MGLFAVLRRVFSRRPKVQPRLHQITGMKLRGPEPKAVPTPGRTDRGLDQIKRERAKLEQRPKLPSPLTPAGVPKLRPRLNVGRAKVFRPKPGPPPVPAGFRPEDLADWTIVASSWIAGLRFVASGPVGMNPRALTGYVDMRVIN